MRNPDAPEVVWPEQWCDTCRARPGEACITSAGNIAHKPHGARGKPRAAGRDGIPSTVRRQVRLRSRGVCEFGACHARAVHLHHKRRRSQGGEDTAANLADLCAEHHAWVHANVAAAVELGLLIPTIAEGPGD